MGKQGPDEHFIEELVNTFPEIKEDVLDEDRIGLIHLQVACFTRFTQKAIDINDVTVALRCFQFVQWQITKVEHGVENALVISWMIRLNFTKNKNLYEKFPSAFKDICAKFEDYYSNPSKNEKLNLFLKNFSGNRD